MLVIIIYIATRGAKPTILAIAKPLILPVEGRYTSLFGEKRGTYLHNGVDIAAPSGTPVVSPADGTVTGTNYTASGGYQLFIEHTNGMKSGYAHLSSYIAQKGQKVKKGQAVARVGSTGKSTGPHLHWTLTIDGQKVNPLNYIA